MESTQKKPEVSLLRKFIPLNEWSNRKLEMLANSLEIKHAKTGEILVELNSEQELTHYLVSGKVQIKEADGGEHTLDAKSPHAAAPISQLLKHRFIATCLSPVRYISIDSSLIDLSTSNIQSFDDFKLEQDIATNSETNEPDSVPSQLTKQLQADLQQDLLTIPSLPEIATRVGRAIEDESCNAEKIARIIQADPAITAKIVKAANSVFYGGHVPVESCPQAVIRLGMNVTHSLVVNYTMQDLFMTKSKQINLRMRQLWSHSIKVAAICYVLGKVCKTVNPDEAMAIGLLHDIGVAAILSQAAKYPDLISDPAEIDTAIDELRAPFGSLILKSWRFSDSYINAAEEAENWMRELDGPTDYTDVVILAQLHSYVGSRKVASLPPLDQVPAIHRLTLGPRKSIALLKKSDEEVEQTKSLLTQ
jgi:HD-like signal output (HDOD) protein